MEIGMIGLGRMGANMSLRLLRGGHEVIGYDPAPDARSKFEDESKDCPQKGETADSLINLVDRLHAPRIVWLMVPSGKPVDDTLDAIVTLMQSGSIIIDGGNSNYKDSIRRAARLEESGIHYVDAGTSGGVWGLSEGYSLMVGGGEEAIRRIEPILKTLAPTPDSGWGRVGSAGAGHFVKMVHNGIEYGMMQSLAEGFAIMEGKKDFSLDVAQIAQIWRFGSVVRSWLLDLVAESLKANPELRGIAPYVVDSGEGRWTVAEAIELNVPAPIITQSLIERLRSRQENSFADRLLAAMRHEFGGHAIKKG